MKGVTYMNRGLKNRMSFITGLLVVLACVVIVNSTVFAQVTVQRERTGLPACTAADKLAIASFTVSNSQPFVGGSVDVAMKISNKCPTGTASLNVPWDIRRDSNVLKSGTVTIDPGTTKEVIAGWWATAGSYKFWGNVDPDKRISDTDRNNNTTSDITVVPWAMKTLTMSAGGSFPLNPESPPGPCTFINFQTESGQIHTMLDCRFSATGLKANPEYFKDLTLKNNWVVRNSKMEYCQVSSGNGSGSCSWRTQPSGSSPRAQIHLAVDAGTQLELYLTVYIEGPAHLSPF